jgi:dienelactone hydrolase
VLRTAWNSRNRVKSKQVSFYSLVAALQNDSRRSAAIVHPAYLDDDSQFQNLKAPLFASLAGKSPSHSSSPVADIPEQDTHFPPARISALIHQLTAQATPTHPNGDSATDEPCGKGNYEWALQMFGGVRHGFALRGDMNVDRNRWSSSESLEACWRWWKRFLD